MQRPIDHYIISAVLRVYDYDNNPGSQAQKSPPFFIFETRQAIEIPRLKSGYQVTADLCVNGSPDTRGTQLSLIPGFHPSQP